MLKRREFMALIGGVATGSAFAPRAHAQRGRPVVGLLRAVEPPQARAAAFLKGLAEAGFVEGQSVNIELRLADGDYQRLRVLADELVRAQVNVIAANSAVAALAAKSATSTIPIVFAVGSDPVQDGLVSSLSRPGGNVTGVTFFANLLAAKQIELLHEIAPKATMVGLLLNPGNANADLVLSEARTAAQALGLRLVVVRASTPAEIEPAFAELVRQQVPALLLAGEAFLTSWRDRIAGLALRHRIAACFASRFWAEAGGLLSYGADRPDADRQAGAYVGRLLKGEQAADLPVVQPTRFELVINLKTAKALGVTVPPTLLARADEVIE